MDSGQIVQMSETRRPYGGPSRVKLSGRRTHRTFLGEQQKPQQKAPNMTLRGGGFHGVFKDPSALGLGLGQ